MYENALNCAPTKCEGCGIKLKKPFYGYKMLMPKSKVFPNGLVSSSEGQWRVDCSNCGTVYIWSHPSIYIKTHKLIELLMHRNEDGTLLRPLPLITD